MERWTDMVQQLDGVRTLGGGRDKVISTLKKEKDNIVEHCYNEAITTMSTSVTLGGPGAVVLNG